MKTRDTVQYIKNAYDQNPEREWERMDRHRTEFAVTLRALEEHLPPPPARVLDCGGGPGRYAIELTRRGYDVTLFDLSTGNLELARQKADEAGQTLSGYEQGSALDLSRFADNSFDAVLLMGPLYHLLRETERQQAVQEAQRVLKPGGPLFAAFITRYATLRYAAAREHLWPLQEAATVARVLQTGVLPPRDEKEAGFVAYFAHPTEVAPLLQHAKLKVRTVLGVEGLVSMIEENVNTLDGIAWKTWVNLNCRVAPDPTLHSGVEHLLAIAVKPRWRATLRELAQQLTQAQIPFKIVGGTSAALHGVSIPVNDIDLETDSEGAYRIQDLLVEQAIQQVALSSSETYRSHFGRFDLHGVVIEVMGDLHRRQGNEWVPSMAQTTVTLDLDGVPVPVSSLEEETLAYMRRQRLERAAQCLPHCDPQRLLALLRQGTPVL